MLIFEGRNRVTQVYGGQHTGIDIVGDDNRNVRSVRDGAVEQVYKWDGVTKTGTQSYGNLVIVRSADRLQYYAHLDSIAVSQGQTVKAGQKIGVMGNTGNSFGAHTHFEVRSLDRSVRYDPAVFLGIQNAKGTYKEPENLNGWQQFMGRWYYYKNNQKLKSQWLKDGGFWYYLGTDGTMQTGWIAVNNEVFYLNEKRITVNGKTIPSGACVITDSRGVLI